MNGGQQMSGMDAFERQLKERLEHYEVPYNSGDWTQMERALASGVRSWGHGRALVAGLLLAGGLLIGGTAYFLGRDTGVEMAQVPVAGNASTPGHTLSPSGPETLELPTEAPVASGTSATGRHSNTAPEGPRHGATAPATAPVAASKGNGGTATTNGTAPSGEPAPDRSKAAKAPASMFRASVKDACPGSPVDFTVENMPEDGIYLWNFGDGSFSNKPNPQHTFVKAGSYQVMLSMSSQGMGTIHNKPSSETIMIHDAPAAGFNVVKQDFTGQLPTVHFENRSLGGKTYLWDLGDGTVSTEQHPDHVYKAKGLYKVELTVTNETGCVDRKMREVRIDKDFNLGAPASFSPNGDGKEETFMPEALRGLATKFKLDIYDPAGVLIYTTTDASHPWCGKVRNQGAVCAAGDYVWMADVDSGNKGTETFTGKVKLVP